MTTENGFGNYRNLATPNGVVYFGRQIKSHAGYGNVMYFRAMLSEELALLAVLLLNPSL